jgi:hypothetical protein
MLQKTVKITIQGVLCGNSSLKLSYFLDFMPVEHKGLIATMVPGSNDEQAPHRR